MVKKTPLYLLISALAIFIFSLSQIQALTCPPGTNYFTLNVPPLICLDQSSPYVDPLDYIDPNSPDDNWEASDTSVPPNPAKSNLCGDEGFYFVDADGLLQKVLTLKINVPKTFNAYKLNLNYRRGPSGQNNENFNVKCGTKSYDSFDILPPPSDPNDNIWVLTSETIEINCDLTQGGNDIIITSLGPTPGSSTHFEQFSLEACIPEDYCSFIGDPACNDNIDCTQDSCDLSSYTCIHSPNSLRCPDPLNPDPNQYCSETLGCVPRLEPIEGPTALLPFFSLLNLLISALIIIFIYFLIKQKRNNKHKAKTYKQKQ